MTADKRQLEHAPPNLEPRKQAEVYYQSLRNELIERVKLRDQVLMAYLGAVAALVGFALRPEAAASIKPETTSLLQSLLVLIPMLSLGASAVICHHQELMSVFTEYFCDDLSKVVPEITMYEASRARQRYGKRAEHALLLSQLLLLCGPWGLVALLDKPYFPEHNINLKEILLIIGFVLDVLSGWRLWSARNFRLDALNRIFAKNPVKTLSS